MARDAPLLALETQEAVQRTPWCGESERHRFALIGAQTDRFANCPYTSVPHNFDPAAVTTDRGQLRPEREKPSNCDVPIERVMGKERR